MYEARNRRKNVYFRFFTGLALGLLLCAVLPDQALAQDIMNQGATPADVCTTVQMPACFNVHKDLTVTETSGGTISFYNDGLQLGTYGLHVLGLPIDQKGTAIGVRGETEVVPVDQPQAGSAQGDLAVASGFFARGQLHGVRGLSKPETLINFDDTMTSTAVGGSFRIDGGDALTLDGVGTYWVAGSYSEIDGKVDGDPGSGRVAAVVGIDKLDDSSTAQHYAGYFDGGVRIEGDTDLNGVATLEAGQRLQAGVAGGARILGSQGRTPKQPAIGFFSTNGVDDGGGGNGIFRPLANTMAFATTSRERMRITSGGQVGIGVKKPKHRLDVSGSVRLRKLTEDNSLTRVVVANAGGVLFTRDLSTFPLQPDGAQEEELERANERISRLEQELADLKALLAGSSE